MVKRTSELWKYKYSAHCRSQAKCQRVRTIYIKRKKQNKTKIDCSSYFKFFEAYNINYYCIYSVLGYFDLSLTGLPLLEVKNDQGERPIDLTAKKEIKEFLRTMEVQLSEKQNTVTALRPSEESYQAVLGRKARHSTNHIPAEKCERYLLILSHLVQAYFRFTKARPGFAFNDSIWMNFDEHCNNLESHVTRIVADSRLSSLACIRIQAMKMLASS